jgi:uncharacterized membrane protein
MGLTEAVLYALRLYVYVIEDAPVPQVEVQVEEKKRMLQAHTDRIEDVYHVVSQGYEADKLMRQLPTFLGYLDVSQVLCGPLLATFMCSYCCMCA